MEFDRYYATVSGWISDSHFLSDEIMANDFSKVSKQILIDQINTDNSTALTDQIIGFALPVAGAEGDPKNTSLVVNALPGSGYTGNVTVTYNRVALSAFVGSKDLTFQKGDATTLKDLIPEINTLLGFNLQDDDYVDAAIPTFTGEPNEEHDVILAANADSLAYIGSITITVKGADVELSTVITTTVLNGLTAPVVA